MKNEDLISSLLWHFHLNRWLLDHQEEELIEALRYINAHKTILLKSAELSHWDSFLAEAVKEDPSRMEEVEEVLQSPFVIESWKGSLRKNLIPPEPKEKEKSILRGSIYLAQVDHKRYTKIGFSSQPKAREAQLKTVEPSLTFIYISPRSFTIETEGRIHQKFEHKQVEGEWFNLTEKDINRIQKYLERKHEQNTRIG